MANKLKVAMVEAILRLLQQGWPKRRIARELDIDRGTVARVAGSSKPAKAPIGSEEGSKGSKPAKAPIGSANSAELDQTPPTRSSTASPSALETSSVESTPPPSSQEEDGKLESTARDQVVAVESASPPSSQEEDGKLESTARDQSVASALSPPPSSREEGVLESTARSDAVLSRSACEPFRALIIGKLDVGLSGQRIHQDLVSENGFAGSYYSVRRFVTVLGRTREVPFRRMECAPGEEVQVDFGKGIAIVQPDGRRQRTHVFRVVLSYSRKAYSEVVYRQTTENFVRCLENAFRYFGGTPQRVVLDNLRAAVQKADWYDPELNPKVLAFAAHYGVVMMPTKSYTPRHKGKVERGVDYVQENGLKGHTFASLEAQNQHLLAWEQTVADKRLHGTTRQQVAKLFDDRERAQLQPLPPDHFPFFHESQRTVHRDGHVEVAKAYYSVPPEYLARRVWVRWDGRTVRIFNQRLEQIAMHAQHERGRFSTQDGHVAETKISGVERGATWLLTKVALIGPQAKQWAEAMVQARGIEGVRVLQGLITLAKKHPADALEKACATAYSYEAYRLKSLRQLLERQAPPQPLLPFLDEHPIIRPLSEYAALVHNAFTKEK